MNKQYKNNKVVHEEPQYYKKRKPLKHADNVYYDDSDTSVTYGEYNETPKNRSVTFKKHYEIPEGRSVTFRDYYANPKDTRGRVNKYKTTYNSDNKYENDCEDCCRSDDEDSYNKNGCKWNCERRKYSPERDMYQRTQPQMRRHTRSETETMIEDDSSSGYSLWETPSDERESLHRQYTRENNLCRGRTRDKNSHSTDTTDTERSQYRSDVSLYTDDDHRGHTRYRLRRKDSKLSDDYNDDTPSDTETQGYSATTLPQSQQHIYMTSEIPKATAFSRERVISVVDYNKDATLSKQKNKTTNDLDINRSEYVYFPVIVYDKPTTKGNNSSESEKPKEEGKSQNKVEVFVADKLEQPSIFKQKYNTPNTKYKEQSPTTPKKKTNILTAIKKFSSKNKKLDDNEREYPVKKAYINVVPSDKTNSKIKSCESKVCKVPKKQNKECVVKPEKPLGENKGKNQGKSTALYDGPTKFNDNKNKTVTQQQRSGILKQHSKSMDDKDFKREPNDFKGSTERYPGPYQSSTILKERKDDTGMSITVIYDGKTLGDTGNTRNQFAEEKTKNSDIPASRRCDVSRDEHQRSNVSRNVTDSGKQQRLSKAQRSASNQVSQEGGGPFTTEKKPIDRTVSDGAPNSRRSDGNAKGRSERSLSLETRKHKSTTRQSSQRDEEHPLQHSSHHPTIGGPDGPETGDPVKLWGHDITPLVYAFQTARFFLGLTMHDKLMEIANQYYTN